MHNNIMAAGLRDRPPMLATGRYPQWRSWFLRYIDTRPNGDALRKFILSVETLVNMSPENKAHFEAEKEAIHLILTGIGDEIYSTVDACQTAKEMWEAIERLQQGESLNIQDILQADELNDLKQFDCCYDASQCSISSTTSARMVKKNLALIAKYFKKIYKPTNNNLKTSSNSRNKNVDTTPWYKNDNHSGQFGNQRTINVARARENVGSPVVQQSGIQCFNCKELGHFAKKCRKLKKVKDFAYHKEKMLLYKQAEQGVPLQAEQYDWLEDTNKEIDEQELEAHYSYMAKIKEVPIANSGTDSEPLEQNDQNDVESDDERVALAKLIANLKLDVDENKKIQKQLKKENTTLAQELKECKTILAETSKTLRESNSVWDRQLAQKDIEIKDGMKTKAYDILVVKEKHDELIKIESFNKVTLRRSCQEENKEKHSISLEIALQKCKEQVKNDKVWNKQASNVFRKEREQYIEIQDLKAKLQDKNIAISELKKLIVKGKGKYVDTNFDKPSIVRQPNAQRIPKPLVLEGLSKPVTAQTLPQTARQA
nr:hypothetical protein [Tanacetum cinerariifolium]